MKDHVIKNYELKHRLTGAAILVFLAVVIIPFLLPEPGADARAKTSGEITVATSDGNKVFKSKIEPLNLNATASLTDEMLGKKDKASGSEASNEDGTKKPALITTIKTQSSSNNNNGSQDSSQSTSKDSSKAKEKVAAETKKSDKDDSKVVMTQKKPAEKLAALTQQDNNDTKVVNNSAASSTSESKPKKEVVNGWAVRVGTFSKQSNVDSVSALLRDSGFNAHLSKVKTNLGDATRIWLGPYENKETAEKVSVRLKSLTGEKGYVTKHTS